MSNVPYLHILVIDDDPDALDLIRYVLPDEFSKSAEFAHVSTLEAGISTLSYREDYFNVVLLDLGLPGYRGIEAFRELRKYTQIPVVVLTGNRDQDFAAELVQEGVQHYLHKTGISGLQIFQACVNAYNFSKANQDAKMMQAVQALSRSNDEYITARNSDAPPPLVDRRRDAVDEATRQFLIAMSEIAVKTDQKVDGVSKDMLEMKAIMQAMELRQNQLEIEQDEHRDTMSSLVDMVEDPEVKKLKLSLEMQKLSHRAKVWLALIGAVVTITTATLSAIVTALVTN